MDNTRIGYMVELLNDLNLFSIDPYNGTGEIILKVKKTNIKKQYGIKYSHSAEFYSMIISSIVSRIISRYDKDIINSLRNRKSFEGFDFELNSLAGSACIATLYNLIPMLDNIVLIRI
jgi:hypothetical protein